MKKSAVFLFIFLILLFFTKLPSFQETESTVDIQIVHNVKEGIWGKDPQVSLKLVRTLGGLNSKDENLAFNSPRDVILDSKGNIYILDVENDNIIIINPEGQYITSIGRGGQGPGDFNYPYSIDIDSSDILYILDSSNRRIQILTTKGEVQRVIKLNKFRQNTLRILKTRFLALGGTLDARWGWASDKKKELPKLIEILDWRGKARDSFGELKDYEDRLVNWFANEIDYDVDTENNFYICFTRQNRIEKYSQDGNLLWKADRILNYDTKVLDKGYIIRSKGGTGVQFPKKNQVSEGITVDEFGRIWIITLNRQLNKKEMSQTVSVRGTRRRIQTAEFKKIDIYKLEIFNPDGFLLGNIPLNHLAHNIRIQKDYLFIFDTENAQVFQYKILKVED